MPRRLDLEIAAGCCRWSHSISALTEVEDMDRLAGGTSFGEHADAVPRDDDCIGQTEKGQVGILARCWHPVEHVSWAAEIFVERSHRVWRRSIAAADQQRPADRGCESTRLQRQAP